MVKQWNRLLTEVVDTLSLDVLKDRLDGTPRNLKVSLSTAERLEPGDL